MPKMPNAAMPEGTAAFDASGGIPAFGIAAFP
jgi:hypothetical protein